MNPIYVIKATGERELFSEEKLLTSIARAGVPRSLREETLQDIKKSLRPEIPTSEIYNHIVEFLDTSRTPTTRFNLKRALFELGPTGFPFEKYVGALLASQGYQVQTDVILKGHCVTHEVDVIAIKDGTHILIECKFHNQIGARTGVKVAMYTWARFHDLVQAVSITSDGHTLHQVWLVTNTKCTTDAISYANCMGVKIISWGYPEKGNLQQLIEKSKLYPVTCLSTLTSYNKQILLSQGVVMCKDLLHNTATIKLLHLKHNEEETLKREIASL